METAACFSQSKTLKKEQMFNVGSENSESSSMVFPFSGVLCTSQMDSLLIMCLFTICQLITMFSFKS